MRNTSHSTSWQPVSDWYNSAVGADGHYFHQHVVLPNVLRLMKLQPNSSVLDLACGQGVLARQLPKEVYYQGYDISRALIDAAKKQDKQENHQYSVADVARDSLPLQKKDFSHATVILALQNIAQPDKTIRIAGQYLRKGGQCVVVLNHPCFRIPRHSSWGIDEAKKLQYRRVDRYMTPLNIPILAHPGKSNSPSTSSFHFPLSFYVEAFAKEGFMIEHLEEWQSDKKSVGKAAKMENRSRNDFPLFLTLVARKI
jgi:ubiquinone/menaquinone biosynthesis C-methylase UbiE